MSNIIYDKIFGKTYSNSLFKTQEKLSTNQYIYYPQNSISSFAYSFSSLYIYFMIEKLSLSILIINFLLFILGFVSFFWWASQRLFIHKFDILLYSSFLLIPGIFNLKCLDYFNDYYFCYLLFFFYALILFLINLNYFNIIKAINIFSFMFSILNLLNQKKIIYFELITFTISIFFKLCDTLEIIKIPIFSGTAIFHLLSGIAYGTMLIKLNC